MPKATRLETDTRVETVRQFILRGDETSDIVRAATETWGIKDRQAWYYIGKAREKIQELSELARPYLLAEHIAVRRDIRMRAQKAGDLRAELAAAQDEAKLFGLYPAEEHNVNLDWQGAFRAKGIDPNEVKEQVIDAVTPKLIEVPASLPLTAALQPAENTDDIPHQSH